MASGAADGTLLLHSLRTGRPLRSLALPHAGPPALLCLCPRLGEPWRHRRCLWAARQPLCPVTGGS